MTEGQTANNKQVGGYHYQKAVQPWDAMAAWMSREEFIGYLRGNIIKYVARCRDKGGHRDLEKAQHYLEKLLEVTRGVSLIREPVREPVKTEEANR